MREKTTPEPNQLWLLRQVNQPLSRSRAFWKSGLVLSAVLLLLALLAALSPHWRG